MLQFPYRNLLNPYEYNQTAFLCDLTKRIDAHEQLSRQSERTERFHLPVADQTAGETLRKILRNSVNRQKENFDKEWEGAYGAGYPFIRAENGNREAKAIAEEISVTDSSKDGWYHIPDRMCAGKADRGYPDVRKGVPTNRQTDSLCSRETAGRHFYKRKSRPQTDLGAPDRIIH